MRYILWTAAALLLSVSGFTHSSLAQQPSAQLAQAQSAPGVSVVETLPASGAEGVAADAAVTVIFDRPMIPLGIDVPIPPELQRPLIFTPSTAGEGEWINTSIYLFRPDPGMAGGITYTVSIAPEVRAVDGARMNAPFSWSFTVAPPRIVNVAPAGEARSIPLDAPVVVTFDQPMDRAATEAAFTLMSQTNGALLTGEFGWNDDSTIMTFRPAERYTLDTAYRAEFANEPGRQARGAGGGGGLADGMRSWIFTTVPLPSIVNSYPSDGETNAHPYGGVTLYFASPMNIDTLADKIIVDPEPWREYDAYYSDYEDSYRISFPTEPSTNYTITVLPGMEDIYGNRIETEQVIRYRTDRYPSDMRLEAPYGIGFYNANAPQTRVYLTHRNVSVINLSLYRVPMVNFIRRVTDQPGYNPAYGYTPDESQRIRSWSLESVAPENVLRYDLLNFGAEAGAYACVGAPPSRLRVGDLAVVISDPDPVRARSEPVNGEIITLLYRDYALPVIAGPVCADSLLWWEVQLREGETGWVAEGLMTSDGEPAYFLDLRTPAAEQPVDLVDGSGEALPPGIYYLNANASELGEYQQVKHLLVVGTASLTLKYEIDAITVWATDIETGQPIPNAPIALYSQTLDVIASGTTDDDGLLRLNIARRGDLYSVMAAVLQTDDHFGIGLTSWSDGVEGWWFGFSVDYHQYPHEAYLYTDRPIYRPGQPVYFRGVVRQRDDVTYSAYRDESVEVFIFDDSGEEVYREMMPLSAFGTFSGTFSLVDGARLGTYRLGVLFTSNREHVQTREVNFAVAEYRAPEFQVTVTPDRDEVINGAPLRAMIDARYFFGGAVGGGEVEWRIVARRHAFDGEARYSYIDWDQDAGARAYYESDGALIAEGAGVADADGRLIVDMPTELDDESSSQLYTLEATVTDETGQAVSGRADMVIHKGDIYIGVRPQNYVEFEGREATVDLLTQASLTGDPVSAAVTVEVVERRWSSVQERDSDGRTVWNYEVEDISITSGEVTTGADGRGTFTFTPPNGGVYKVNVRAGGVRSASYIWVAGARYVPWRQQNSNRIDLIADAEGYDIGDTAEILIAHPFQGETTALITVERGGVLFSEVLTLDTNSYVYRLPISADYIPNVYVTVLVVKGVDQTNPVAAFRMGMVQLGVETNQREITLDIRSDLEQAGPGDTVNYTIRATNYLGEPVQAEIGVGLTDLAVLSIAPPNTIPLITYFYGQQPLGVITSSPLTINTDQITQTILDTIKGGGGGFGEGGIFDIREEFVDTPYWNSALLTDGNGEVTFPVMLPDNLTTWRLDARAVTRPNDGDLLVGQTTFDLISTKPVLIRPVTPRFFVVGDRTTLAAVVNNNTDADLSVTAALQAQGVTFLGEQRLTQTINAGGRARFEWDVTVDDVQQVDLTFFAASDDGTYTDASKPPLGQGDARTLPVYRYSAPTVVGTAGVVEAAGEREEQIVLSTSTDTLRGGLTVQLEPSLGAAMLDELNFLRNYPHQCAEQTVSRFLPNIMTYRALVELGVVDRELERQLAIEVSFGIQRLAALQKANGGWGWYAADRANSLTTAYALIGLIEARAQGYPVDSAMIERAVGFLRSSFIAPSLTTDAWQLDRQAFILYALSRAGSPDVGRMSALYDFRASLSHYARALLALALPDDDIGRVSTLMSDLLNHAIVSAAGIHWEEERRDYYNWNTNTRSTAIILMALAQTNPDSDLLPNIVRWLMQARSADSWETTQETAWAVMGLTEFLRASGVLQAEYGYSVALNGETLLEGTQTNWRQNPAPLIVPAADLLVAEANRLIIGRGQGSGTLFYTAYLKGYLHVPDIEPLNNGIIVQRRYTNEAGETVTSARVGELIQARLTLIAPTSLHYLLIEDPIPAGTDAVNPDLLTSQQIGTQPEIDPLDPFQRGWGWWWFSEIEFRDEMVVITAEYLPAGAYEFVYTVRPGLPGEYNVLPTVAYEFYFPDVMGRGAGSMFTITD